jgi:hypothetical protein
MQQNSNCGVRSRTDPVTNDQQTNSKKHRRPIYAREYGLTSCGLITDSMREWRKPAPSSSYERPHPHDPSSAPKSGRGALDRGLPARSESRSVRGTNSTTTTTQLPPYSPPSASRSPQHDLPKRPRPPLRWAVICVPVTRDSSQTFLRRASPPSDQMAEQNVN